VFQRLFVWPLFAALMGFALGGSVAWGIMYAPPQQHAANDHQPAKASDHKEHDNGFWEKAGEDPVAYFTLWLVGFTGVLAASTIGLWIATWRASTGQARDMKASIAAAENATEISRQAMIAGERAFIFATGALPFWEPDAATGNYNWRFCPQWTNTGDTPTKNMTMNCECLLRDTPLPAGFDFEGATTATGTALIAPKFSSGGGLAPRNAAITPQDILDTQAGTKYLYLFGWAKYHDVFPDTPQHITRFCFLLTPTGNPITFDPHVDAQTLKFPNILHTEGNCADDECGQYGPKLPEVHSGPLVAFAP
jgi:hypothetical protein